MAVVRIAWSILVGLAGYSAACGQQTVSLAWDPSPETNVVGYYIYFGVESGVYTNRTAVGNTNTCTVGGLAAGATYFFVVTSADGDGLESDPSNEVAYLVPGVVRIKIQGGGILPPSIKFPVVPKLSYELQASQDLKTWISIWTTIGTANEWVEFQDLEAAGFNHRFYRLYSVPAIVRMLAQPGGILPPSVTFPVLPGLSYELQASQDLQSWSPIWSTIGTTNEWVEFQDPAAADFKKRFYRLVLW